MQKKHYLCRPNWIIMQRKLILFALVAFFSMSLSAQSVNYLTTDQFKTKVFNYTTEKEWKYLGDKPCIIDFYTTWCGPCKMLAPIMEQLAKEYAGKVYFYKVDVEQEREIAQAFQITSFPRILYIPQSEKPMMQIGLQPKEEIKAIIDEHLITK